MIFSAPFFKTKKGTITLIGAGVLLVLGILFVVFFENIFYPLTPPDKMLPLHPEQGDAGPKFRAFDILITKDGFFDENREKLDRIIVNKNDGNQWNLKTEGIACTFAMNPYEIENVIEKDSLQIISFEATREGEFEYSCSGADIGNSPIKGTFMVR
jgi:hypothetical protein